MASTGWAQSVNLDIGEAANPATSSYGGAAAQAGTWNDAGLGTTDLVDISGLKTDVQVTVSASDTGFSNPPGDTDDERLSISGGKMSLSGEQLESNLEHTGVAGLQLVRISIFADRFEQIVSSRARRPRAGGVKSRGQTSCIGCA